MNLTAEQRSCSGRQLPLSTKEIANHFNLAESDDLVFLSELLQYTHLTPYERLLRADAILCGYGVEALYDKDGCTPIAEYINFGDVYSPTLLYNIKEAKFELTSWGSWYKEWEIRREQAIKLEYIGPISSGTLRADDLVPCFIELAEAMATRLNLDQLPVIQRLLAEYCALSDDAPDEEWDYILEDIEDILNDLAPDGYYFGAHPGDGSDFGFWKNPK
jgi:hypothetical protein